MVKIVVDPGYGFLKAATNDRTLMVPSGMQAYSHEDELLSAMQRSQNIIPLFFKEGKYVSIGEFMPQSVEEAKWTDKEEITAAVAGGVYKLLFDDVDVDVNNVEDMLNQLKTNNYDVVVLAPVEMAKNAVKLEGMLDLVSWHKQWYYLIPQSRYQTVKVTLPEGVAMNVRVMPQPMGSALYFQEQVQASGKMGAVVVDIGLGTVDVMSFLMVDNVEPEWDRKIIQDYDILSGNILEQMLVEDTGYDIKLVRVLASRGKLQFSDKKKKHIKNRIMSLIEPYLNLRGMYALIISGGGGALLSMTYSNIVEELTKEWETVFIAPSPTVNVEGWFVK